MNALHAFHFLYPWWLLLALVPPLTWLLWRGAGGMRRLDPVVDAPLRPFVLARGAASHGMAPWLAALALTLVSLALAGPAWQRVPAPVTARKPARVVVMSLSHSMLASDLKPDRLTRARYKVHDLLEAGRDARNALVAYAGEAYVVAPLTSDIDTIVNLLSSLDPDVMPVAGDDAAQGIDKAVDLLHQAGFEHGDIILVADHAGASARAAARRARAAGVHVSVLGVGTGKGTPVALPEGGFLADADGNIVIPRLALSQLRQLAEAGGGIYRTIAVDGSDVHALVQATREAGQARKHEAGQEVSAWRDEGPWLLLGLLPLAALGFRRGWLLLVLACVMLPSLPARAGGPSWWDDLWLTPDQQAARALSGHQPAKAAEKARSPGLRGSARYRQGQYDAAAQAFAAHQDAQSQYNLGNALARQGKYRQALQAWNRALQRDPSMDDARANRKAVQDWLKRRQSDRNKPSQQGGQQQQGAGRQGSQPRDSQGQGRNSRQGKPKPGGKQAGQDRTARHGSESRAQQGSPAGAGSPQQRGAGKPDPNAGAQHAEARAPARSASASRPATAASIQPAAPASAEAPVAPESAARARRQTAEARAAQKAVGQAVNQHMQQRGRPATHKLGDAAHDYDKSLSPDMKQALERVPDDPGGLLRRKFMLEHQRRQQEDSGS